MRYFTDAVEIAKSRVPSAIISNAEGEYEVVNNIIIDQSMMQFRYKSFVVECFYSPLGTPYINSTLPKYHRENIERVVL